MSTERDFEPTLEVLKAMQERLAHPDPVFLGPVTDSLRDLWRRRFDSEGIVGGEAWEPLSEYTLKKKEKDQLNEGILVGTGILRDSLTERDTLTGYEEMRDDETLAVGTQDPVAALHEYGTRHLPRRQITPDVEAIPGPDIQRLEDLVAAWVVEGMLDAGGMEALGG